MKYPSLIGLCKDCIYKCFRCEDINFRVVYQCKWNKEEKEKEYVQEEIWKTK